ncbi:hypothetical protein Daus18300_009033 [Diaporthe australafricana]|uniref:Uncharacterized protein n=1 Tax=Diaporthe australafricana TaxID=127596 RepID=A0ABR3WFV5_9PEZI
MIAVSPNDTWAWTQSNTTTAQVSLATWRICEHTFSNLTSNSRALYVSSKTSNPVRGRPYATDDDFLVFVSNSSSSTEYRMSKAGFYALDLSMEAFFGGPGVGVAEEIMSKTLDMDLKAMTENIAAELSSQIRSSSNTKLTSVVGAAFSSQVYIRVRWIWLTLPVAEVLVTCLALLFTIMANRGQPLLKSSVLALLASDVEQANLKEVSGLFNEDAKRKPMEDLKARFRIGGDGRIVFSNKGGESLSSSPQVQGSDFI